MNPVARALAAIAALLPAAAASAASDRLQIEGYLQPQLGVRYLPDAVPRDRWNAGLDASAVGVELFGSPIPQWSYRVHLILGNTVSAVDGVTAVDSDEDGNTDQVETSASPVLGMNLEEATLAWAPHSAWAVRAGRMRIPFTAQHQSPATALLFHTRSGPNDVFLSGPDLGALVAFQPESGVIGISAGVFNGDVISERPENEQGVLYSARADVQPLGVFQFGESDRSRGPLRLGIGAGVMYRPAIAYDDAGYGAHRVDDLRASASVRVGFRGLLLQAEALRRQVVDELTSRTDTSSGGYAQGAFLFPFGVEPIARLGSTVESEELAPRRVLYREAGLNWYPHPRDKRIESLRVSVQYQGEERVTENEEAHGVSLGLQLLW